MFKQKSTKMSEKTMLLIESSWNDKKTFKMIPVSESAPYVECIFDPSSGVFVVISKQKKTTLHMLPKLDEYGNAVTGSKGAKQERHKIEVFQEYYIDNDAAIKELVDYHAVNSSDFDYEKFMLLEGEPTA